MHDFYLTRSGTSLIAGFAWLSGLALILIDLILGPDLGDLGLFISGIGGVATIRRYFCKQEAREDNAFRMGVAAARDAEIHLIR